jgi:WD40 repeat protein
MNWSPDGRYLAVGGQAPTSGNEIQIYSFSGTSLTLVDSKDYGTTVYSMNWSPDGRYLAVGGQAPTSGNEIQIYSFSGSSLTLVDSKNYGNYVNSMNWSPDGRYLAVGGNSFSTGHEKIEVYKSDFVNTTTPQSLTNSVVFGDSAKGSAYDAYLRLMPGASVNLTGKMLYDNVN